MLKKARRPQDWGQREKHELYGLWGWHKDRNRYGMVSEWAADFWEFVLGVGKRPSAKHRLRRHKITQPLGPTNFFWDTKYAPGSNKTNTLAQRAEYMREYRKRRPRNVRNTELKKTLWDYSRQLGSYLFGPKRSMRDMQTNRTRVW
jgi:hypothetical protein